MSTHKYNYKNVRERSIQYRYFGDWKATAENYGYRIEKMNPLDTYAYDEYDEYVGRFLFSMFDGSDCHGHLLPPQLIDGFAGG